MGNGDKGGVVEGQGDSRNGLHTAEEAVKELSLGDIEDVGREDVAVVEDLDDGHTVRERRDVQQVEQGSFGSSNTASSDDHLDIGNDFNGTTGDFRGDTEGLEEGGLSGLHTGITSRNGNIQRSESTSTSGSSNLVGSDQVTDFLEVGGSEDETDVATDVRKQLFELRVFGEDGTEGPADHGVLAHHNDTLSTESNTDLVHLVGSDIVDVDDEDGSCIVPLVLQ